MTLTNRKYGALDIVRIPFLCAPATTVIYLIFMAVSGLAPMLQVLFVSSFIDTGIAIVSGGEALAAIYLPAALVVAIVGYRWVYDKLNHFAWTHIFLQTRERFRVALTEKRARLEYYHIENAEDWDLIGRVCKEPENRVRGAFDAFHSMAGLILNVSGILAILLTQVWWAALIIIAMSVPLMYLAMRMGKASYQADRDMTKIKRVYDYLSEVLISRDTAEERALFGYTEALNEKYIGEFETARKYEFHKQLKWFVRSKASSIVFAVLTISIAGVLIQPTVSGALTLGTFMALLNAIAGLIPMFSWTLSFATSELVKGREYYKDVSAMVALTETPGALGKPAQAPEFKSLELKNVRFRYPGTEKWILDGVSFTIESGKHYAFVGANGAGKTTITRLLTGLYTDFEGKILLNGRDIREYPQSELKAFYSVIYQDFARYQVSVLDNIAFEFPDREMKAQEALDSVELTQAVSALAQGVDTPLGKLDEKGQDLSGGEWQRLAMARAAANPAPLRILDEPTAALDPIAESQVYQKFEEMSRGITTLFISHRLGSTRLADTIFVLDGGKVAETGVHESLMRESGLYTRMYEAQRSWYQ